MAEYAPGAEPRPLRLADLWRARRSFVYRFEIRRLARGRRAAARRAAVCILAGAYVLAALLLAYGPSRARAPEPLWAEISWLALCVAPFALLAVAPVVGAGVFAAERAGGTLDALVMSPIPRCGLVAARLLVEMRALGFLALVVLVAVLSLFPLLWRNAPEGPIVLFCCFWPAAFLYLSVLLLYAALGLWCGLRYRSRARALLAGFAAALGIGLAEMITFLLTVVCLDALLSGWTALYEATGLVIGALLSGFGLGCLNLHVTSVFVEQAAWLFDRWAVSD